MCEREEQFVAPSGCRGDVVPRISYSFCGGRISGDGTIVSHRQLGEEGHPKAGGAKGAVLFGAVPMSSRKGSVKLTFHAHDALP